MANLNHDSWRHFRRCQPATPESWLSRDRTASVYAGTVQKRYGDRGGDWWSWKYWKQAELLLVAGEVMIRTCGATTRYRDLTVFVSATEH